MKLETGGNSVVPRGVWIGAIRRNTNEIKSVVRLRGFEWRPDRSDKNVTRYACVYAIPVPFSLSFEPPVDMIWR